MKDNKRRINKGKLLLMLLFVILIVLLILYFSNNKKNNGNTNNNNVTAKTDISSELHLNDVSKTHDEILELYGKGSDNYNIDNKIFATTYIGNVLEYNSVNIFYYNDDMTVKRIEYVLSDNFTYEVLNNLRQTIGNPTEYNGETEELSIEFIWKYEGRIIILRNNISQVNIIIE